MTYYKVYACYNSARMTFHSIHNTLEEAKKACSRITNGYASIIESKDKRTEDIYAW